MLPYQPGRSRWLTAIGAVLCLAGVTVQVYAHGHASFWLDALSLGWLLFVLIIAIGTLVTMLRAQLAWSKRPAWFHVSSQRFSVDGLGAGGMLALMVWALQANTIAATVNSWRDINSGERHAFDQFAAIIMTGLAALLFIVTTAYTVMAWRGIQLELSPAGILWHTPMFRRLVPWEALAIGGPHRPQASSNKIELAVLHPKLVVQRGWIIGGGSRQHPALPVHVNVHPWFLADAIRWYAEHPEDRAAIGTQEEHRRLIATLYSHRRDQLAALHHRKQNAA